ncbi:hypothetical protein [Lysinibacillus xylanilyticus]|uniref:hypothetical protein n=1 Tax=Lysinibacillus xylanilyticus TaxID=582475 RepID=UPI003D00B509
MLKVLKIVVRKSYPKGNNRGTKAKTITSCDSFSLRGQLPAAAASLSRKKHLPLPLRFRAKNICRFAFSQ